ncbi:hypothetical protein BGZ94_008603 [Podila epigama]|nr:hypothetical protein BGZ94_008603 [Podila epigama]
MDDQASAGTSSGANRPRTTAGNVPYASQHQGSQVSLSSSDQNRYHYLPRLSDVSLTRMRQYWSEYPTRRQLIEDIRRERHPINSEGSSSSDENWASCDSSNDDGLLETQSDQDEHSTTSQETENIHLRFWKFCAWLFLSALVAVTFGAIDSRWYHKSCSVQAVFNGSCPASFSSSVASLMPQLSSPCHKWPFRSSTLLCGAPPRPQLPRVLPEELRSVKDLSAVLNWIQDMLSSGHLKNLPSRLDELFSLLARFEVRLDEVSKEMAVLAQYVETIDRHSARDSKEIKLVLEAVRLVLSTIERTGMTEKKFKHISQMIEETLQQRQEEASPPLMPDYALLSAGARVIHSMTFSEPPQHDNTLLQRTKRLARSLFMGQQQQQQSSTSSLGGAPDVALQPSVYAGECWTISGDQGQIAIRLARRIVVTAVTIEQADPRLVLDVGSAPREIEIWSLPDPVPIAEGLAAYDASEELARLAWGLPCDKETSMWAANTDENEKDNKRAKNDKPIVESCIKGRWWNEGAPYPGATLLTTVEYDANGLFGSPMHRNGSHNGKIQSSTKHKTYKMHQTFTIPKAKQDKVIGAIILKVNSNWGHSKFTCLYRIMVHGHQPEQNSE